MPLSQANKRRGSDDEAAKQRRGSLKAEETRREVDYGIRNTNDNRRLYREMMMEVKMPIFRRDVEVAWHTIDRSIDSKVHGANLIVAAVEKAREQYEKKFLSHVESIDRFLQIYGSRLRDHEDRYRSNLEYLVTSYLKDRQRLEERQNEDEVFMKTVTYSTEQRCKETYSDVLSRTIAKVDVQKENNENSRRMAAAIIESIISSRWIELRGILDDYEKSTRQRRRAYETIKAKDDREREIMERQISTTALLSGSIRELREKISHLRTTAEQRISEIAKEHAFFQNAYRTLQQHDLSEKRKDKMRLVFLTKEHNTTTARLKKLLEKAEKILLLMHNCSKLETEDEKILQPSVVTDDLPADEYVEILQKEFRALEGTFWRKVAVARVITSELSLERSRLAEESLLLRECLRQCLADRENAY